MDAISLQASLFSVVDASVTDCSGIVLVIVCANLSTTSPECLSMKKTLLAAGFALAAFAITDVSAIELVLDGEDKGNIVTSFSFNGGVLTVSTDGSLVVGDPNDQGPGTEEPGTEEPGTEEPGTEEPGGGTDQDEAAACAPANIVCKAHIANFLNEPMTSYTIERGKTVVSRFVTGQVNAATSSFGFSVPTGTAAPSTHVWISEVPGGSVLGEGKNGTLCTTPENRPVAFNYTRKFTVVNTPSTRVCSLKPNTTYYINLKHVDTSVPNSSVHRWLQ